MKQFYILIVSIILLSSILHAQNRRVIDSLNNELENTISDSLKISLLYELAARYDQVNLDSMFLFLQEALLLSQTVNVPVQKARTIAYIGGNYFARGHYLKSLEYLDLAYNIAEEHELIDVVAYTHEIKAHVFSKIDKLNLANEHANIALQLYTDLGETEKIIRVYGIFSTIYSNLGDHRQSLNFMMRSYQLQQQLNDPQFLALVLNNLGNPYLSLNMPDSSYYFFKKAASINKKYDNKEWLAINYSNLAHVMIMKQKPDSAGWYIDQAMELYKSVGYNLDYYTAIATKATIALLKGDTASAVQYYDTIVHAPEHFSSVKMKSEAFKSLYDLSIAKKEYRKATAYFEGFKHFDDLYKEEANTSLLTVLELQMEYEKKHERLSLENNLIKLKSKQKNIYLIFMSVIIFLLAISVFLVYKFQKAKSRAIRMEKKMLDEEIEFKNREITANVMSLMKKNELLTDISKDLLEIEKRAVLDETKSAIHEISKKIIKTRDVEIWKEFDIRFKQVHSQFYDRLISLFPDLSPSEQRLCALLRMNLNTKEISELIGLHPRSIDNARFKLRKKLNLTPEQNLVSFLVKLS